MIKKILAAIAIALIPFVGKAQLAVGSWKVHKPYYDVRMYNANYAEDRFVGHQLLDTPQKVYYVSLGGLFSYDKNTQESYAYNSLNKLSDNYINGIWYNYTKHYLLISYSTGNIDLLYDDGTVINLPDISDTIMTTGKTIYDVCFDGDFAYVATNFGLVKFNVPGRYVVDSGIYNLPLSGVAVVGDDLWVSTAIGDNNTEGSLYRINKNERINSLGKFTKTAANVYDYFEVHTRNNIVPTSENTALCRAQNGVPCVLKKFNDKVITRQAIAGAAAVDYITPTADGKWMACSSDGTKIYTFSADGTYTTTDVPQGGWKTNYYDSLKKVWTTSNKGIASFDVTTSPATMLSDYAVPTHYNQKTTSLFVTANDGSVFTHQFGVSQTLDHGFTYYESPINRYVDGEFENVSPALLTHSRFGEIGLFYDALDVCPDPEDPDTYYVGALWEGVIRMQRQADGTWKETAIYNPDNSPLPIVANLYYPATAVAIDNQGNLWVTSYLENANEVNTKPNLMMLPANKRKAATVSKSDWKSIKIKGFIPNFDTRIVVCQHPNNTNLLLFLDAFWGNTMLVYDTKGTSDTSDDTYNIIPHFVDQDGKTFESRRLNVIKEDQNGHIWIGTHSGILEIANPRQALTNNITVNRLKVPRNDGSGYADYLLDAVDVFDIAVDGANNKWIASSTGGLYHVSAAGDKVLEQFNTSNSPILANRVIAVGCVPNSNKVLVGTDYGVMEYSSSTAPAAETFDNVYAYPNPVRPEYTGWITIKGLMDNSQVKITDAYGNVFYNCVSEGGMVIWDGCNRDGERVKTGVYYVYASQSGEGISTQGAVTKILVVN